MYPYGHIVKGSFCNGSIGRREGVSVITGWLVGLSEDLGSTVADGQPVSG